nr:site-specific integrase [Bacillus subtilis]
MYYTLFLLAIHTGMRKGEFLGLRWQDVNLETGYIYIKQSLVYDEDGFRFTEPKTESSKRGLMVYEKVVKALKKYKKTQNEFKLLFGKSYHDYNLVFCREDGQPIYPRTLAIKFDNIIKKANVPKIRIQDLRHTMQPF